MKCPYCNKEAEWLANEAVYGKRYGRSYMVWVCKDCLAYVGCHVWKNGNMSRKEIYRQMEEKFGRPIHMGEADIETCKEIIRRYK